MARTKSVATKRGRGRPRKDQSGSPKKEEETRYVLASAANIKSSPATERRRVAASSGSKKKRTLSPMTKFARQAAAAMDRSSEFGSPLKSPVKGSVKGTVKGRKTRKVESEDEVLEDEEEEDSNQDDSDKENSDASDDASEDEEDEEAPRKKKSTKKPRTTSNRMGPEATINATFRLNLAAKVQRLRSDPRFTGIKAETLERVVEQFEKDNVTPSVIVNTTVCKPVARRTRVAWTTREIDDLHEGVARYGTSWSKILADEEFDFNERTQVDLKDKWRNINSKRLYSELPIRRFILVNEHHEPAMTDKGYYHVFNNRWPADAAVKVATKDFIYPEGVDSVRVYLREIPAEGKEGAPVVHVFDVSRKVEVARNIPKFQGMGRVFVGEARKICTERLLTRQAVFEDFRDASRMHHHQ